MRNVLPDDPGRFGNYTYLPADRIPYDLPWITGDGQDVAVPRWVVPAGYIENGCCYCAFYGPPAYEGEDVDFDGVPDNVIYFSECPTLYGAPPPAVYQPWSMLLEENGYEFGELPNLEQLDRKSWQEAIIGLTQRSTVTAEP
jgi:hypothetical protein